MPSIFKFLDDSDEKELIVRDTAQPFSRISRNIKNRQYNLVDKIKNKQNENSINEDISSRSLTREEQNIENNINPNEDVLNNSIVNDDNLQQQNNIDNVSENRNNENNDNENNGNNEINQNDRSNEKVENLENNDKNDNIEIAENREKQAEDINDNNINTENKAENKTDIDEKSNSTDDYEEDFDEDDEDEDDIDLNGMKKAFSNMYTNIVVAPVNKSEKYKRMRERMERNKKQKKKRSPDDILKEKLKNGSDNPIKSKAIKDKKLLDETELAKDMSNSSVPTSNITKNLEQEKQTEHTNTEQIQNNNNNSTGVINNDVNTNNNQEIQQEANNNISNTVISSSNNAQENNTQEKQLELSGIVALTTTRPIEIAFDLESRYIDAPITRLNMHSHNSDFEEFVNDHLDIKFLDMSDCNMLDDFTPLKKLNNLEQLDISGCRNFKDLSLLNNMPKLKVLNLALTGIEDISNLPDFPDLEVLSLKLLRIKDIDVLAKYQKLHDLVLWYCSALTNINVVSGLHELRLLDIDSCTGIKSIEPIRNLTKLVYLNLNFLKMEDLSPIQNLINLQTFTMEFSPLALTEQNLSYFEGLTDIRFLGLRNRMIRNLKYFQNMTKMAEMELGGNVINNLTPLENMTEMQILNLSTNSTLMDISPLHKMQKLQKLHLNGLSSPKGGRIEMLVSDISVAKELKSLKVFESNFNKKLKDISPLQYCSQLEEFSVNSCLGIEDITPLRFCKKLTLISVENCMQIRDISFIKYLTELQQINISKTSADRLFMSNWTRLYNLWSWRDSSNNVLVNSMIVDSVKFRKKISKTIKKSVKEDK